MSAALSAAEASIYPGPGLYLVAWKADDKNEEKIKEEVRRVWRGRVKDEVGARNERRRGWREERSYVILRFPGSSLRS